MLLFIRRPEDQSTETHSNTLSHFYAIKMNWPLRVSPIERCVWHRFSRLPNTISWTSALDESLMSTQVYFPASAKVAFLMMRLYSPDSRLPSTAHLDPHGLVMILSLFTVTDDVEPTGTCCHSTVKLAPALSMAQCRCTWSPTEVSEFDGRITILEWDRSKNRPRH